MRLTRLVQVDKDGEFRNQIGNRVRELRNAKGISQEAFAGLCGLHRTHISLVERGRLNMTIETLKAIIDTLEISASLFFKGIE